MLPWGIALSTSAGAEGLTACQHRHCISKLTLANKICPGHQASCSFWDEGWKHQGFTWSSQGVYMTHEWQSRSVVLDCLSTTKARKRKHQKNSLLGIVRRRIRGQASLFLKTHKFSWFVFQPVMSSHVVLFCSCCTTRPTSFLMPWYQLNSWQVYRDVHIKVIW